jgi:hypothetical protein
VLQVRCKVDFDLNALRVMFEATDQSQGQARAPRVREITEATAAALGIFQVRFTDQFRASPDETLRRWEVVFHLVEVRSIPETKEERARAGAEAPTTAPPGTQTTRGAVPSGEPERWLAELLLKLDAAAGKYLFSTED